MSKSKSPVLGRGLESLLGNLGGNSLNPDKDNVEVNVEIANIPIDKIIPNPEQPRKEFDPQTLIELSQSIRENGVIVPITVNKKDDKYVIIAGERRYKACKMIGLKDIPAYIRIVTPTEQMRMALIENIQRDDLNSIEIALSLKALLEETQLTQEDLAKKLGKSRTNVTNYLRLLQLPAEVQISIRSGKLSMGQARALINIEDEKEQLDLAHKIIEEGLSVRQVEMLTSRSKKKQSPKLTKKVKPLPEMHTMFMNDFSKHLNTVVSIKRSQRGKGSITIPFKNDKEFERIVALLENK